MTKPESKTHVVVTHFRNDRGNLIVHAYGPWTAIKANRVRKKMREENFKEIHSGAFTVTVCKMLDPEEGNR